jgi:hypothetical protein
MPCPVPRRPPRAVNATARRVRCGLGQPGQRSAARKTPHILFFFQKNGDFQSELRAKSRTATGLSQCSSSYNSFNINRIAYDNVSYRCKYLC